MYSKTSLLRTRLSLLPGYSGTITIVRDFVGAIRTIAKVRELLGKLENVVDYPVLPLQSFCLKKFKFDGDRIVKTLF